MVTFNVLLLQEPVQMGQRIVRFRLDFFNEEGEWEVAISGTTVGYKKLLLFHSVKTSSLRLVIDKYRADPLISYLGLYLDPFSVSGHMSTVTSRSIGNGSYSLLQTAHINGSSYSI